MLFLISILSLLLVSQGQDMSGDPGEYSTDNQKQVIVVSLPGKSDVQYLNVLPNIANVIIEIDGKTKGRDHMFVIHDQSGLKYLEHNFTNAHLIEVDQALDLWMRDFPPCMPKQQIKFKYRPQYLSTTQAKWDEGNFERFAKSLGLPKLQNSELVLEGGNIVDNGVDAAITTERTYDDNSDLYEDKFIETLKITINRKVAVLPDPRDTTGHADGLVSFVEEDVLLISLFDDADGPNFYNAMKDAVRGVFPDINVVPLPCYIKKSASQGFVTAEGSYANSLVTNNAVYLPFFSDQRSNQIAFDVFKRNTDKEVLPVYTAGKLPALGGSVRCMTWQIDQEHLVAKALSRISMGKKGKSPQPECIIVVFMYVTRVQCRNCLLLELLHEPHFGR